MFTLEKFSRLEEKVRLRHVWRWLKEAEVTLSGGKLPENLHNQLLILQPWLIVRTEAIWKDISCLHPRMEETNGSEAFRTLGREINRIHHEIAGQIGQEAAEWDLREGLWQGGSGLDGRAGDMPPLGEEAVSTTGGVKPGIRRIFLDDLRSPFNVGSIFRTAEVFGFHEVILSPRCPALDHPRLERSAMGCVERMAHRRMDFRELVESGDASDVSGGIFALELGGTRLSAFRFPGSGIVVLGNEELGVNPGILKFCHSGAGRVTIPMKGTKASLNVAVSFGILAHAWAFA